MLAPVAVVGCSTAAALDPAAVVPASPATGHSQVIAQGVVEFGDANYQWRVDSHLAEPAGSPFVAMTGTFLVAEPGTAVHVEGAEGTSSRLADGEATFRQAGSSASTYTGNGLPAAMSTIAIWPADDADGEAFAPGVGSHDVDLLRDVLASGETFTLQTEIPAFVMVTAGTVDDGTGVTISAGATAHVVGDIALTNASSPRAVILVAVIGPVLDLAVVEPPPVESTPTDPAPTDPGRPTAPPSDDV